METGRVEICQDAQYFVCVNVCVWVSVGGYACIHVSGNIFVIIDILTYNKDLEI